MKTEKKVTAPKANRGKFAIACDAIKITPRAAKTIDNLRDKTASNILPLWDYREAGFSRLSDALKALKVAFESHSYCRTSVRKKRGKKIPAPRTPRIEAWYRARASRDEARRKNRCLISRACRVSSISEANYTVGSWFLGLAKIDLDGGKTLLLVRKEDCTWGNRKNSKWPESKTVEYAASIINSDFDAVAKTTFDRRGDWMARVGEGLGLKLGIRTALTQSAAMVPVETAERLGVKITTLRLFGEGFALYAAEAGKVSYHAETPRGAVAGLIEKARAGQGFGGRKLRGSETLNRSTAKALGFCREGIESFLSEIGLADRSSAKVAEIRKAMLGRDVSPWDDELKKIGLI